MTLPHDRSRVVAQTYTFLLALRYDEALPEHVRKEAARLLRHFPTGFDIYLAAHQARLDPSMVVEPIFGIDEDVSPLIRR
jgi:hypothetical protein